MTTDPLDWVDRIHFCEFQWVTDSRLELDPGRLGVLSQFYREDLKKHVKLTKDDDATIDMNQVTAIRIPDDPGWNQSLKEAVRYLPRIQRIQIPRIDHKVLHICSQWNELTELSVDKNSYQWFNTPTTIYFQSPWHREMFRVVDSVIGLAPHLSEIVGSYVPYLQTDASQLKNRVSPCGPQELGLVTTQKSPEMVFHNLQHLVVRSMTSPILENLWRERFPALTSLHIEPDRTYDSPFTKEQNRCLLASVNYLRQLNRLTLIGTNIDLCFLQSLFLSSDADDQQLKWLCISGQNATQPFYDVLAKTSVEYLELLPDLRFGCSDVGEIPRMLPSNLQTIKSSFFAHIHWVPLGQNLHTISLQEMPLDQDAYLKFLKDWHASPLLLYNLGTIHLSIMPKYLANDEAIAKFSERNDWFQKIFTEAAPGQPAYFGARSQLRDWSVISSATKYAVHGITSTMVRRHGNLVRFAPLKCNQLMSALQQNAVRLQRWAAVCVVLAVQRAVYNRSDHSMASGVDSLLPHILREDETRIEPSWIAKFVAAKYAQNLVQESSHKRKLQHLV